MKLYGPSRSTIGISRIFWHACFYTQRKDFTQKREKSFDVHIEDISNEGDLLKVVFYEFREENGKKLYTTGEARTLTALPEMEIPAGPMSMKLAPRP